MKSNKNENTTLFAQQIRKILAQEYKRQRSFAIRLGIARAKARKASAQA